MPDTTPMPDVRLQRSPVSVIGSDRPTFRALLAALAALALPGAGFFSLSDNGLRRHNPADPQADASLRESYGDEPVLQLYLVDHSLPRARQWPARALLTLAVALDDAALADPDLRARCDLLIRRGAGEADALRVLVHSLYQVLFEQGPM